MRQVRQATYVGRNGRPPCQLPSKGIPSDIYKGLRGIDSQKLIKFDCAASDRTKACLRQLKRLVRRDEKTFRLYQFRVFDAWQLERDCHAKNACSAVKA